MPHALRHITCSRSCSNAPKSYGYLADPGPSSDTQYAPSGRISPTKPARRGAIPLQREFSLLREGVKRALGDDVDDEEHDPKKLRMHEEDIVDGDNHPRWHNNRPLDTKRGSKRNNEEVEELDEEEIADLAERLEITLGRPPSQQLDSPEV